jgi:hypothetical protein
MSGLCRPGQLFGHGVSPKSFERSDQPEILNARMSRERSRIRTLEYQCTETVTAQYK